MTPVLPPTDEVKKIAHATRMRAFRTKKRGAAPALAPTQAQYSAFARAFDSFNASLFDGKCPPCVLTFGRHHKSARGYFSPDRWTRRDSIGGERVHEIALNPSAEHDTPRGVASTLVHEMCHAYQYANGTPSRAGYHNEEWSRLMEQIGLQPSDTGEPCGKRVGQKMTHYVLDGEAFDRAFAALGDEWFLPFREVAVPLVAKKKPAAAPVRVEGDGDGDGDGDGATAAPPVDPKVKRKYVCPTCGNAAWGKGRMFLACAGAEGGATHDASVMEVAS